MSEQSTKDFLLSREGRPALLGVIAMLVIFPMIGVYTYSALYPSQAEESEPSDAQRAAAGSSEVEARPDGKLQPDLTSQNLTPEARGALDQFNDQAYADGRMGQPTPDDVVLIDVENESDAGGTSATGLPGNQNDNRGPNSAGGANSGAGNPDGTRRIIGYTDSGEPIYAAGGPSGLQTNNGDGSSRRGQRTRLSQNQMDAIIGEHEEYRSRRFTAAVELINFESTPASVASMSFASQSNRTLPKPTTMTRNADGTPRVNVGDAANGGRSGSQCEVPLIRGGEIRYAQTDIALNTDFEGPVRMTFLEGNLRGYIGMGTFELNELGAKMKLKIDRLFDPDGQSYSVSGYVLDPNTTLWAMSSDVDYHIIYRYGGFGLGSILSAFSILAENRAQRSEVVTPDGTRTTEYRDPDGKQVTWTVLGEFSELFEEAFRDNLNRPITVTLNPNEEAGVLFEDTVCELNTDISKDRRARERREAMGYGDPLS